MGRSRVGRGSAEGWPSVPAWALLPRHHAPQRRQRRVSFTALASLLRSIAAASSRARTAPRLDAAAIAPAPITAAPPPLTITTVTGLLQPPPSHRTWRTASASRPPSPSRTGSWARRPHHHSTNRRRYTDTSQLCHTDLSLRADAAETFRHRTPSISTSGPRRKETVGREHCHALGRTRHARRARRHVARAEGWPRVGRGLAMGRPRVGHGSAEGWLWVGHGSAEGLPWVGGGLAEGWPRVGPGLAMGRALAEGWP